MLLGWHCPRDQELLEEALISGIVLGQPGLGGDRDEQIVAGVDPEREPFFDVQYRIQAKEQELMDDVGAAASRLFVGVLEKRMMDGGVQEDLGWFLPPLFYQGSWLII